MKKAEYIKDKESEYRKAMKVFVASEIDQQDMKDGETRCDTRIVGEEEVFIVQLFIVYIQDSTMISSGWEDRSIESTLKDAEEYANKLKKYAWKRFRGQKDESYFETLGIRIVKKYEVVERTRTVQCVWSEK